MNKLFPFLLVLYEIATYLSNDMYLPAVPQMMIDLQLTMAEVQLTLTVWFAGLAAFPLILGVISDRFGRRPVLLIGGVIYILALVISALTSDFYVLLLARFIQGGMTASMMVAGYACIHELYEHKEAIRILALMSSISILAPALGPLFGSFVLYAASWRGIFWIIAIWSLLAIVLLTRFMPETHPKEQRHKINIHLLLQEYWHVITNTNYMLLMLVLGFIFTGFIVWITAGPLLIIKSFQYQAVIFLLIASRYFWRIYSW